jgi:hypothetical protein
MPKLAISYRRSDSSAITGRIFDRLIAHYGREQVFMDIDNIPFGTDFRTHIQSVLQRADLLIVVIGPRWLGVDAGGAARMAQADDPVRAEVEMALSRDLPLIPVLVDGAKMPEAGALPASFKDFAFRNAAEVATGRDFHPHVDRLIEAIDSTVGRANPQTATAAPAPHTLPSSAPTAVSTSASPGSSTGSWPTDLVRYLVVPVVILLAAHHVIVNALDLNDDYLRAVTIAVPFGFGFLLAWHGGRGAAAAVAIAAAVGLIAVSGMTVSEGLSSGDPILPQTRFEWRDNIEFAASIALSLIGGHAAARGLAAVMRRKIQSRAN